MAKSKLKAKTTVAKPKAKVAKAGPNKAKKAVETKPKAAPKAAVAKKASKANEVAAQKAALVTLKSEKAQTKKPEAPASKVSLKGVKAAPVEAKAAPAKAPKKTRMTKAEEAGQEKATQLGQKWSSLYRKAQEQQTKPYNMRHTYEAKTPIMHKVLGWGYILTNKNDRLEVLFKDGIRYLISNYKA